jgi:hypothetical protein
LTARNSGRRHAKSTNARARTVSQLQAVTRTVQEKRDDHLILRAMADPNNGERWWALAGSNRRPPACKYVQNGSWRTPANWLNSRR